MDYKEYFEQKSIKLSRIKRVGFNRHGIPPESIDSGARVLYEKIKSGLKVKDVALTHRIFAEAKTLPTTKGWVSISSMQVEINRLAMRMDEIENTWWKRFKTKYPILFKEIHLWRRFHTPK